MNDDGDTSLIGLLLFTLFPLWLLWAIVRDLATPAGRSGWIRDARTRPFRLLLGLGMLAGLLGFPLWVITDGWFWPGPWLGGLTLVCLLVNRLLNDRDFKRRYPD